jgi:hypothetical protein
MIPNRLTHSRTKYKAMTNFAGAPQYSVGNSNTGVNVFLSTVQTAGKCGLGSVCSVRHFR